MSDVPSRALRETLRDQLTPSSSGDCLDAETLAAWEDGTLNRANRATAESHAASCARCQAMLAAMARTAAPVPARRWWQTSAVRWLVPLAATAVLAVAVWTKIPTEQPRVALPMARSDRNANEAAAPVAATRPADVLAPREKATEARERADSKHEERPAAKTTQPGAVAESDATRTAPPVAVEAAPLAGEQQAVSNAPAAAARDEAASPRAQAPAPFRSAVAETVMIAPQTRAGQSAKGFAIRSPNQSVRWRIVAGASVERSTDGGSTWQGQSIGAAERLTAGAAPTPTICWIVGARGTVLLSRDGVTWQRVAFPDPVDLTAIRATDDSNATATAADGRVFTTTDGGKTWRSP